MSEKTPTQEEINEENRKIRKLRLLSDLTMAILMQADISLEEASNLVASVKNFSAELFPGKEHVFDLVLSPRFRRVINERFRLH